MAQSQAGHAATSGGAVMAGLSICSTTADKPMATAECVICHEPTSAGNCKLCGEPVCNECVVPIKQDDFCFLCAALVAEAENHPIRKPSEHPRFAELLEAVTTTLQILESAREKIAGGWCQGYFMKEGKYCAVGAINRSGYGVSNVEGCDPYSLLRKAIALPMFTRITLWNDTPGRTQAEVVAVFDKAIELAKVAR